MRRRRPGGGQVREALLVGCAAWVTGAGCFPFPPGTGDGLEWSFDFREGIFGWSADAADYPIDIEDDINFDWGQDALPAELGIEGMGLRVESFNRPDDLFTFIKRRFGPADGVVAGQTYRVRFEVLVASNAPANCLGVGGAPGESVYLKAGASSVEPLPVVNDAEEHIDVNVDVGDQEEGGLAASLVGNIVSGFPCDLLPDLQDAPYALLLRRHEHETSVAASDDGELWAMIGTDSGFEGLTRLYYVRVNVTLAPVLHP